MSPIGAIASATFLTHADREVYPALLATHARKEALSVWAWCLMTNHVHLLVVPEREDSMALALVENLSPR